MSTANLLLVSLGLGAVPEFIERPLKGLTLAFVPTAGKPYADRSFVERDRALLLEMGFQITDLDLEGRSYDELRRETAGIDAVFVAGGNTFYLLQQVRLSGFDRLLPELVENGVPYIGASAGAIIVGPDTEPVSGLDNPADAPGLESFTGLGIVDFVILPHYGDPSDEAAYRHVMDTYQARYTITPLRNDQAVVVRSGDVELVASP